MWWFCLGCLGISCFSDRIVRGMWRLCLYCFVRILYGGILCWMRSFSIGILWCGGWWWWMCWRGLLGFWRRVLRSILRIFIFWLWSCWGRSWGVSWGGCCLGFWDGWGRLGWGLRIWGFVLLGWMGRVGKWGDIMGGVIVFLVCRLVIRGMGGRICLVGLWDGGEVFVMRGWVIKKDVFDRGGFSIDFRV